MLSPYRVLDLTNDARMFCGYLLAHLGAEVVSIPPPGEPADGLLNPTFAGSARSLWSEAYARGRTHLDLDLERQPDRSTFHDLVANADIVIHGFNERVAAEKGLAYDALHALNPSAIVVAITAFGGNGPKADWPSTDLTVWASSGAHFLAGDADRAPVRTSVPQAFFPAPEGAL